MDPNTDSGHVTELPPIFVVGAVAADEAGHVLPTISIVLDDRMSVDMTGFAEFTNHRGIYLNPQNAIAVANTIITATNDIVRKVASMTN